MILLFKGKQSFYNPYRIWEIVDDTRLEKQKWTIH
jgi:hypothetical protein